MASAKFGLMTNVDVNGPMDVGQGTKYADASSPATWALVWFVVAVLVLFVL